MVRAAELMERLPDNESPMRMAFSPGLASVRRSVKVGDFRRVAELIGVRLNPPPVKEICQ